MKDRKPAETFPPGEFIKDELEARHWTQEDLAWVMGRDSRLINEVITGKRSITPETARGLGQALDTSPQYWMNLQAAHQLAQGESQSEAIPRRSRLYEKAPVRLMVKRNWIEGSSNIDVLEQRVCAFFQLKDIDENPRLVHAASKSTVSAEPTPVQWAWLYRAVHLASAVDAKRFTMAKLDDLLARLKLLLPNPQDIRLVPRLLSDAGIRFIVIEPLPQSKIDGVTFWLGDSPIIALSMRYDRIDYFWHTLGHELAGHVKHEDGKNADAVIDLDLPGQQSSVDRPQYEIDADKRAVEFLVPQSELDGFIRRVSPIYTPATIIGFANRIHVHPGMVVGQLQHPSRGELTYSQHRKMLVPVRSIITGAALTDGWGHSLPANI